ncbi:MAG: M20/M25/M40 family metallo-hydrolase, partial [Actinobacteria bacterium]|nr:M20/M25/M40 family metallo-hydrolase [Actinomycetota bacterium]
MSAAASVEQLLGGFLEVVSIPSPAGEERALADHVLTRLAALGLAPVEDDAAGPARAGSGNIFVRVEGAGGGLPILLCAHLDTVHVRGPIEPVVEDGIVRSTGDTILGADDKVAVSALMALLADLAVDQPAGDVEVLFTVCEEVGLRGAKAFDLSRCRARAGFVLDSSGPLREVIIAAPASRSITAEFRGAAAHAGIEPELGRSAVVAASRAISAMRLGRLDEQTTANVGIVEGGVATNIVPERCVVHGEARSRDPERLADQVAHMLETINVAAAEVGVDVVVDVVEDYEAFDLSQRALPPRLAAEALRAQGIEPRFVGTGGGSDVNVFNARGLPSVNLSAGYERVHSAEEHVPVQG